MASPVVSGLISDILVDLDGTGTYTSGQVQQILFKNIQTVNGLMGTCFSGNSIDGFISPEISGTVYYAVFLLLVEKELTKRTLYSVSRSYNLTSFAEGDSKVTVSDASRNLGDLYARLNKEFMEMVNQIKYTIVSQAPASIVGGDAGIDAMGGLYNGYRAYPEKV